LKSQALILNRQEERRNSPGESSSLQLPLKPKPQLLSAVNSSRHLDFSLHPTRSFPFIFQLRSFDRLLRQMIDAGKM
jgi:hypothetical protein